jgi:acetolactate synthase I/II/III large subunit
MNTPREAATEHRIHGTDNFWSEYGADEWSDAIVASMKLGGVENLYFVSGSEMAFYQEAIVKAESRGWPAPKLVTMIHESVALHAALGSAMVTGQPSAAAVHIDVGTLHYGSAVHAAWRGNYPVMLSAGTGPRAFPGSMRGARDQTIHWLQEPRDQGEIVRQYTKADHRMEHSDNPGLMVSRLLQLAMSEPKGPVYLAIPRETAGLPYPGVARFPTRDQLGVAVGTYPDPDHAKTIAEWLVKAQNPLVLAERLGRDSKAVDELVRLAELLALPVSEPGNPQVLNFPTTHPLSQTGPTPKDCDVCLVLECIAPWIPGEETPPPDSKIAWVSIDPVQSRFKTMEFRADLWIPATAANVLRAVHDAATGMLRKSDQSRIAERRLRLEKRKKAMTVQAGGEAVAAGKQSGASGRFVAYELGRLIGQTPGTILLNDALSNGAFVQSCAGRTEARTYFRSGSSAGGWGAGAAFGAKMAAPDQDVVLASGDGFFEFGTPSAAIWAAAQHNAPFLSVVFVNASYSTGTTYLRQQYPDGFAVKIESKGGTFEPPPDFAKLCEASGGYGEYVDQNADLGPALRRALDRVHQGVPAVVAVRLPSLGW